MVSDRHGERTLGSLGGQPMAQVLNTPEREFDDFTQREILARTLTVCSAKKGKKIILIDVLQSDQVSGRALRARATWRLFGWV